MSGDYQAWADTTAYEMRDYYEASRPLHWWQKRNPPGSWGILSDELMLGLMNVVLNSRLQRKEEMMDVTKLKTSRDYIEVEQCDLDLEEELRAAYAVNGPVVSIIAEFREQVAAKTGGWAGGKISPIRGLVTAAEALCMTSPREINAQAKLFEAADTIDALVMLLQRLRSYPSVRAAIGDESVAEIDEAFAKIGGAS